MVVCDFVSAGAMWISSHCGGEVDRCRKNGLQCKSGGKKCSVKEVVLERSTMSRTL
jgi:hypothetical protein